MKATKGSAELAAMGRRETIAAVARRAGVEHEACRLHAGGKRNPSKAAREKYKALGIDPSAWEQPAPKQRQKQKQKKPKAAAVAPARQTPLVMACAAFEALHGAASDATSPTRTRALAASKCLSALRRVRSIRGPQPPYEETSAPLRAIFARLPEPFGQELAAAIDAFERYVVPDDEQIDLRKMLARVIAVVDGLLREELAPTDVATVRAVQSGCAALSAQIERDDDVEHPAMTRWRETFDDVHERLMQKDRDAGTILAIEIDEYVRSVHPPEQIEQARGGTATASEYAESLAAARADLVKRGKLRAA